MQTLWRVTAVILALGWAIGGVAGTATAATADDAIAKANAGRCDEAYAMLSESDGLQSRARLLVAQCRIRAGLYPEALNDLNRIRGAKDLTPSQVGDVELYRAVAFYHLERYTEASAALGSADGLTGEEAQVSLYRGLIALRNGDNERAAPALETAARLSAAITEPVASYYAGLAWQGSAERAKARAAFERVVELDGDGPWGKEAAKMLEATAPYPYFVTGSVGVEYDDNVLLRGGVDETSPGVNTNGERDWRGVWRINAGIELFEINDFSGGITGGYSGNAHKRLPEFDIHYPTIGAYVSHRFSPDTTVQARYQFGFAWVGKREDSFLRSQIADVGLTHAWAKAGTTGVTGNVTFTDLRIQPSEVPDAGLCPGGFTTGCGPAGLREDRERNRDGVSYAVGLSHTYPMPVPSAIDSVLRGVDLIGLYQFRYNDTEGDEWQYAAQVIGLGFEFDLPMGLRAGTHVGYEFRDFMNASTFPDQEIADTAYTLATEDRREHEITVRAEVEKELTECLSVSARYAYLRNRSNRQVFDYDRHVVGAYLNFRFD